MLWSTARQSRGIGLVVSTTPVAILTQTRTYAVHVTRLDAIETTERAHQSLHMTVTMHILAVSITMTRSGERKLFSIFAHSH